MRRSPMPRRKKPLSPKGFAQPSSELRRTEFRRGVKPAQEGEAGTVRSSRRAPLAPRSLKRAGEEQKYRKLRVGFLAANPYCKRCGRAASEVHHMAGRRGPLLLDVALFCPLCAGCHRHVTEHPKEAVEQGYSVSRVAS